MNSDSVKNAIADFLLLNRFDNQDVKVILDGVFSGLWIWEENSQKHVHFHQSELVTILGLSDIVLDFILEMRSINTSWRFINPRRMGCAVG